MATKILDAKGLKCPMPVLKMTQMLMKKELAPGDVLEVTADCPTFENDIKTWCATWKKVLVRFVPEGASKKATIQI